MVVPYALPGVPGTLAAAAGNLIPGLQDGPGPLPGGAAALVRFIFGAPQWIQVLGALLALALGCAAVVALWRSRDRLASRFASGSSAVRVALGVLAGILLLAAATTAYASYDYVQHSNDFCSGCHVMDSAYHRFTRSEHSKLNCHDCHQQSMMASMRQLYLWVKERPEEVGPHAPVPNRVCESCHVVGQAEIWQRIRETAGHRSHLESDSAALRDIQCVTCHGQEVHAFVPTSLTCGLSGCHENLDIALGAMARQTTLHCVTCHPFTAEVPRRPGRDPAEGTLIPREEQCLGCHEMRAVLPDFDAARDPHRGACGLCHNPHLDEAARDAAAGCATSGCHADWTFRPFHTGPAHRTVARQCTLCHQPHRALVDASDCTGCHAKLAGDRGVPPRVRERLRRSLPFDTAAALRRSSVTLPPQGPGRADGSVPRRFAPQGGGVVLYTAALGSFPALTEARVAADSFSHRRHTSLSCLNCHTTQVGHGRLTFAPPRGCRICHHQEPNRSDCSRCHRQPGNRSIEFTVAVAAEVPPRTRSVTFEHSTHSERPCITCHVEPVTLSPPESTRQCRDCHDDHHQAGRSCAACHPGERVRQAHERPAEAHLGCDACHAATTVARLTPDRGLCGTCHAAQRSDHHDEGECTTCHMLAPPDRYRRRLVGARP
jgi:hypothetical protein